MRNSKGYTLVELLAVIVIIGILAGIAVPVYGHFMDGYKKDLCEVNRVEMARLYEESLVINDIQHSPVVFEQFLQSMDGDVCPVDGELTFVEGDVECSVHGDEEDESEEDEGNDDGGVPFL